jgi:tRNA(Ile)-lysidine synthase
VQALAKRAFDQVRRTELIVPGDRVGVAVSGGIDSVALLRLMLDLRHDLGIVLSVVHFNHKLRGSESEADQEFVAGLAREHGLEFYCSSGDVAALAAEQHSGIEGAAREMRYGFFRRLLTSAPATQAAIDDVLRRVPHGLKSEPRKEPLRGAEGPLFHGKSRGAAKGAPGAPIHEPPGATEGREPPGHISAPLNKIATGHTLDDQAETVIMRLIRGTGMRGLGGIYPRIAVEDGEEQGEIVRPLLGIRRRELEQYLREIEQSWREDTTNSDSAFTRNRVRKLILPMLEKEFNPSIAENLSELAEIARDEQDYWDNEVSGWLGTVVQWSRSDTTTPPLVQILSSAPSPPQESLAEIPRVAGDSRQLHGVLHSAQDDNAFGNISLSRPWLLTEPRAVQRRVLKAIAEQAEIPLEFKHVEEILRFAAEGGPSGKELSLPLGWKLVREPEAMVFVEPDPRHQERTSDYEYTLPIPGRIVIPELGTTIEAVLINSPIGRAEYNPQQLLRADLLTSPLTVRNWRAGDKFWPTHTKTPKKVKELLQARHVGQPERRLWPVATSREEMVWMRGFPVPKKLHAATRKPAVFIREILDEADEQLG